MDNSSHEPGLAPSPWAPPPGAARYDGWTGPTMATFCETLAATGLVVDACLAAGRSRQAAYALRHRDPVFAAAWAAALAMARSQLCDALLARSLEGSVEHYYRDGELVGERRHYESWLALSVLNRLDKRADLDRAEGTLAARLAAAWPATLDALRDGGSAAVPALVEGNKVDEVDTHAPLPPDEDEDGLDLTDRCWKDDVDEIWMTDFPPPAGFAGWQSRPYDEDDPGEPYNRACSEAEIAILEASLAADRAAERAEDAALRDEWFALLQQPRDDADAESKEIG